MHQGAEERVAYEVAQALNALLDVCLVRKLGVPGHKELAMGAIASGGVRVLNYDVIRAMGISSKTIDAVAARELKELQRRDRAYRGGQWFKRYFVLFHSIAVVM